ncbi:pH-response regulator protein palH/rim-21 [Hypoxylon sp. NC1633]|nr:pH-response regulator protein palH/rim-21 [Hypoxylon sp. NC1633]
MDSRRARQPRLAATTTLSFGTDCTPFSLPSNGLLIIDGATPTTLMAGAIYSPLCTATPLAQPAIIANGGVNIDETSTSTSSPQLSDLRDPFYASIFPQCYALAATTVLAYLLLVMLFIAPRSFLDGGVVVLGRRGFTNGPSNGISIGGRPWLQKVAALTVAISLTIATVDTFRVAEDQYAYGTQNAQQLQEEVLGGTQLKVIQLISDTFLWLAQAQTLIRLFPRQREKVIIKWTAFSLITLDVIFGALNNFQYAGGNSRPRSFTDAVPALNYLFQLSLGLLYAAWVLYYSLMKKRYAFYHPLMKNICLMATLSIISILVPVVFFVLDIAKPEFTGWGDYVRWVGATAASVVVWEWVERIEALEREEKKDGVLGREVFDGDEMMEVFPSDLSWPRRRKNKRKNDDDNDEEEGGESGNGSSFGGRSNMWPAMSSIASRCRSKSETSPDRKQQPPSAGRSAARFLQPPLWPSRPPPAVTPVSRTDTASADSTVYAVRYQPLTETTSRTTDDRHGRPLSRSNSATSSASNPLSEMNAQPASIATSGQASSGLITEKKEEEEGNPGRWRHLNPFHRAAREPPAEVLPHTMPKQPNQRRDYESVGRWDLKGRVEFFAATQAERILEKIRPTPDTDSLPVTVIPAPPRRGAALAQLLEEEEFQVQPGGQPVSASPPPSRPTRNPSTSAGSMPPPHHGIRVNTMSPSSPRSVLGPAVRDDMSVRRPFNSRDGNSLTASARRSGDQRERVVGERRPVDDVVRDDQNPNSSPV